MPTWKEKQNLARAAIERIKQDAPGVERAEDAISLQALFDDARKLLAEADRDRAAIEKERLADLLDPYGFRHIKHDYFASLTEYMNGKTEASEAEDSSPVKETS
jgi:hypothetical protein